jgi:hypothetical protein
MRSCTPPPNRHISSVPTSPTPAPLQADNNNSGTYPSAIQASKSLLIPVRLLCVSCLVAAWRTGSAPLCCQAPNPWLLFPAELFSCWRPRPVPFFLLPVSSASLFTTSLHCRLLPGREKNHCHLDLGDTITPDYESICSEFRHGRTREVPPAASR